MARRLARFTREEAVYWLSRTTSFGSDANRWLSLACGSCLPVI